MSMRYLRTLALIGVFCGTSKLLAQPENDPGRWDLRQPMTYFDRAVHAIVPLDGKLVFGGKFNRPHDNPFYHRAAIFDTETRLWSPVLDIQIGGDLSTGHVYAIATREGKIILAGDFTTSDPYYGNPVALTGILVADPETRTFESLGSGVTGRINTLFQDGDTLFVGGAMTRTGEMASEGLGMWVWSGNIWATITQSPVGEVFAIQPYGDRLFVGGHNGLAVWNRNTKSWMGNASAAIGNGPVRHLSIRDGFLYAAGGFNQLMAVNGESVARMDLVTNVWQSMNPPQWMNVTAADWGEGTWMLAGSEGENRFVMAYESSNGVWTVKPLPSNNGIFALTHHSGRWYFGGEHVSGYMGHAVEYDAIHHRYKILHYAVDGGIYAMVAVGGQVYFGGQFGTIGHGTGSSGLGRWDHHLSQFEPATVGGWVYSLRSDEHQILIGHRFGARWMDWETGAASPNLFSSGIGERVHTVAAYEDRIVIGGQFSRIGSVTARNVAIYDKRTGSWQSGNANGSASSNVLSMVMLGDTLYVGGVFLNIGGVQDANMIGKRNMRTGTWHRWAHLENGVNVVATDGRNVFISGSFTHLNGDTNLGRYARYDTWSGTWHAMAGDQPASFAYSMLPMGDYLYVGHFGVSRYHLPTGEWLHLSGGPSQGGPVRGLARVENYLYVGGEFRHVGGKPANHFTRYRIPDEIIAAAVPDHASDTETPSELALMPNIPNPFNPQTIVRWSQASPGSVDLALYDVIGRRLATLASGYHPSGIHSIQVDGSSLASGVYIVRIIQNGQTATRKIVLSK